MVIFYSYGFNTIIISIICGLIIFSILNFKNKAFLGDSGVFLLSFFIGYLYVKLYNNTNLFNSIDIVLFLFLPVIDSLRVMFQRQFLENKQIFIADKLHFHHIIIKKRNQKSALLLSSFFVITPHLIFISPLSLEYFLFPFLFMYFLIIFLFKN